MHHIRVTKPVVAALALVALLLGAVALGDGHGHSHGAVGEIGEFIILDRGAGRAPVADVHDGHWHGALPKVEVGGHISLGAVIVSADGRERDLSDPSVNDFGVALAPGATEGIVELVDHGDHVHVRGVQAGATMLVFTWTHRGELRYTTPPMAVQVGHHEHDQEHDHAHDEEHDHAHDEEHDHAHDEEHDHDQDHDDDRGHGHGHGHRELEGVRLLVASLDAPELVVVDLHDGEVIARFTVPSAARVYALPNLQVAAAVHRDANRVSFIHSGLYAVDHGDHQDLVEETPFVLQTTNYGPLPTHFFARGNDIGLFMDGDGRMAWLDARLLGISLDYLELDGLGADHGALAALSEFLLGGGLAEAAVRAYDRSGVLVATFGDCPGLHGQAVHGEFAIFGCSDGVLIIDASAGVVRGHKVANPMGTPERTRVGTVAANPHAPVMVGNFGSGIAWIDPIARTLTPMALPAAPAAMRFHDDGELLLLLTLDGFLHAIDVDHREVRASVQLMPAIEAGVARPTLVLYGDHIFVADPSQGAIHLVEIDAHDHHDVELEVEGRILLGFRPGSLAPLAIPGALTH
jgi:hypothetical protein